MEWYLAYNAGHYLAYVVDMKKRYLGEFEHMVLLAALHIGKGAYAVTIRRELEKRAGRRVARGALYTSLERLESKGYLTSVMSEPTPERGGRSKRCYAVSPTGVRALRTSKEAMLKLWRGLDSILGKAR